MTAQGISKSMDTIRSVKKLRAVKSNYSYLARLILVLFSLIIVLFLI